MFILVTMIRRTIEIALTVLMGAVVAAVGAGAHRALPYVGVVLSILAVLAGMVFARAWLEWVGVIAFAVPWAALTTLFSQRGPGNSLLISADALGYLWLFGGAAMIIAVSIVPARWLGVTRRVGL